MIEILALLTTGFFAVLIPIAFSKGLANKVAALFILIFMLMFSNIYIKVIYNMDFISYYKQIRGRE